MFKRLAITASVLAIAVAGSAGAALADTSITGIVRTDSGARAAGATVFLYRAPQGGSWSYAGRITTTDSTGRYSLNGLSNWRYYQVRAQKYFGLCQAYAFYDGWGAPLWATGGPRGSDVTMKFVNYFSLC